MAQQYHVTQIPCFVMLVDGVEKERSRRRDGAGSTGGDVSAGDGADERSRRIAPPAADVGRRRGLMLGVVGARQTEQRRPSGAGTPRLAQARPMTHTAPLGPREPLKDAFSNELIGSSVRLRVDDANGHSYGTGTIIDSRSGEALVITCGHLFRDSKGKGPVMVELFTATPDGARVVAQVPGQIIDFNLDRDIGLVSIRPNGAGARRADRVDATR